VKITPAWLASTILCLGSGVASAQLTAVNRQLVSTTRVSLTQYDYAYTVDALSSAGAFAGLTATVTSSSPNTIIIGGYLTFPNVPAGGQVTSTNTFIIEQNRLVAFDPADLTFQFQATGIPQANAGSAQVVTAGSTAVLSGSGSYDPAGMPLTYSWSFLSTPASSTASLSNPSAVNPTFFVDQPGNYLLQLVVSDGTATSLPFTVLISTNTVLPVANAGPGQTVTPPSAVQLDGSGSSDVPGHILTYVWLILSKPSGSSATLSSSTAVRPVLNTDLAGEYLVQLIVSDGTLQSVPSVVAIQSGNTPPVANAGPDQSVAVGSVVQLIGSGSTDVNGNALTYQWSLAQKPAGSSAALTNATTANPFFIADVSGIYVAQLTVSDGHATSSAAVLIGVCACAIPVANAGLQQTVPLHTSVVLNGSGSIDPNGTGLTYQWALIARPAGSAATVTNSTSAIAGFTADVAGDYVAQLIVTGSGISSLPSTVPISTVRSAPIAALALSGNAGNNGNTYTVSGAGSSDPNGAALTWSWALLSKPAGSSATLSTLTSSGTSFFADKGGYYVVQLIVNDGTAGGTPETIAIPVNAPPTPAPTSVQFFENTTGNFVSFTSTDQIGGQDLTVTITSLPPVTSVTGVDIFDAGTATLITNFDLPHVVSLFLGQEPALTLTPVANWFGQDLLSYAVSDHGFPNNCGTPSPSCAASNVVPATLVITVVPE